VSTLDRHTLSSHTAEAVVAASPLPNHSPLELHSQVQTLQVPATNPGCLRGHGETEARDRPLPSGPGPSLSAGACQGLCVHLSREGGREKNHVDTSK
jgi:hypothetical protein